MDHRSEAEVTVLLVDVQPPERRLVPHMLPSCAITVAGSGREALRELNARPFDVYVCDFWLPDWSGAHLCRTARRDDPNAPVLIYTAQADDGIRARALRAGAAECLRLPLDPALVREHVLRLGARARERSTRARPILQRAIADVLRARGTEALAHARGDEAAAARMLERAARAPARSAFFSAGGTAACLTRWWDEDFAATWAIVCETALCSTRSRAAG